MSNYIIEDEIEDEYYRTPRPSKRKRKINNIIKLKHLIIGGAVLVVIFFIILVASRVNKLDEYQTIEKDMVEKAQNYVENNNIIPSKEIYILVDDMGFALSNDCSLLSGVFYSEGNYEPYLMCNEHRSKLDNNNSIDLVGEDVIFIKKDSEYYELGYVNTSENISISGNVNAKESGVYKIYYMSKNSSNMSRRKVVVVDNLALNSSFPKINIINNDNKIEIGQKYNESVSAFDRIDGDISNKIIKINNVKESEVGTYKNIYSITNSFGYTTMLSQSIIVLNSLAEEDTSVFVSIDDDNITNTNVRISIKVIGNNYDHLLLPDGNTSNERELTYEVVENGDYIFTAVNKDDTKVEKSIKVSTIDKTIPTGTCKAILYSTKTSVSVNISSFNRVVAYNYIINNKESGYIANSYYNSNVAAQDDVYVKIKDYIGNENQLKCTTEKKYSYDSSGYRDKTYMNIKDRLYIPITDALSKKGHTVAELNSCIYNRVQTAGPGTRYGVAAAAYGLIDCTYKMTGMVLAYDHTGGKLGSDGSINYCAFNSDICGKLGINTKWGKPGGTPGPSYGLNCATFVGWSLCNGGMDLCTRREAGAYSMTDIKYYPGADGVYVYQNAVTYYAGTDLTKYSAKQVVRMLKPGDIFARQIPGNQSSQHAAVVIGIDSKGIYTANDGYYVTYISYDEIANGARSYRLMFLDKYYENAKNRNKLYN